MLDSFFEIDREVKPCHDAVKAVNLLFKLPRFSDRHGRAKWARLQPLKIRFDRRSRSVELAIGSK